MNYRQVRNFFLPLSGDISHREKFFCGLSAVLGIFLVAWISRSTMENQGLIFLAASMGSAAVLVFAMPHSPMAQPWPLIGGQVVSAFVGVICFQWIPSVPVAAGFAIGGSIVAMFFLRCLNPPGGSAALGAVLGGPAIQDLGFSYVLVPVGLNVFILLLVALLVNNLLPGRRYPFMPESESKKEKSDGHWVLGQSLINDNDIQKAMENADSFIDVDREDLRDIFQKASINAYKRRMGPVSCGDIMTAEPIVINSALLVEQAREIMTQSQRRTLPVVNNYNHVIGLLTQADVNKEINQTSLLVDIMRPKPKTVTMDQHIVDIIPLISCKGWRSVSVVDNKKRIMGIITRSDIMSALVLLR